jgi:phospholipase/lecithinase/hemolysin
MAEEAVNNPDTKDTEIYVRDHWHHYFRKIRKNKNINLLPEVPTKGELKKDQGEHWGSGGYAVLLAAVLGYDVFTMIGFDLYPIDHAVNNIYKGSANYARIGAQAVDPSYWVYQIGEVFTHYPNITFVVYNRQEWKMPQEWRKNNVKFIAL